MTTDIHEARDRWLLAAVGVVPFLLLAAWHWHYGPLAVFGDWAQYLSHADALLHGRRYADIGYIFTTRNPFIGPPAQPPGLPAVLVPLLVLTDGARDGAPYKLLMVAFALAFLGLVMAYFTRHDRRVLGVAAAMMTGVWIEIGFATNAVQSDLGFCAFVWGIFYLADRPGKWSWRRVAGITVLGLLALAFRLAALPLFPALATFAIIHRRTLGARPWVPVVVWSLFGLAALSAVPGALVFARLVPTDPAVLVSEVIAAAKVYPFGMLELFLYPFPGDRANDVYHVIIAILAVVGAVGWARRALTRLLTIFAVAYVGMLLVLPMQDTRYVMPLAPLVLYGAANGIAIVLELVAARAAPAMRAAWRDRSAAAATVVVACVVVAAMVRERSRPAPPVLLEIPGVTTLFDRLRSEAARSPVRVLFMNPRVLTWRTGVPAMGFFAAPPDSALAELRSKGITHVVVGDVDTDPIRARAIGDLVAARPAAFRPLYTEGIFAVYAFDPSRAPAP